MAKRNRVTLKEFFRRGALPSESQFGDLIDSTLNMIDEGFDKSAEHGLEITPLRDQSSLISFFRNHDPERPVWTVRYDGERDALLIQQADRAAAISFAPAQPARDGDTAPAALVGIGTAEPRYALEVKGVAASTGRTGTFQQGRVPADGDWHPITPPMPGCQALEVVAGVGRRNTGHYALLHAVAMNTYNPRGLLFNFLRRKTRIHYHQAYYRSLRSKMKLRWAVSEPGATGRGDGTYCLQLRTNFNYGQGVSVQYNVTQLWFDPFMDQGQEE